MKRSQVLTEEIAGLKQQAQALNSQIQEKVDELNDLRVLQKLADNPGGLRLLSWHYSTDEASIDGAAAKRLAAQGYITSTDGIYIWCVITDAGKAHLLEQEPDTQ